MRPTSRESNGPPRLTKASCGSGERPCFPREGRRIERWTGSNSRYSSCREIPATDGSMPTERGLPAGTNRQQRPRLTTEWLADLLASEAVNSIQRTPIRRRGTTRVRALSEIYCASTLPGFTSALPGTAHRPYTLLQRLYSVAKASASSGVNGRSMVRLYFLNSYTCTR